jgi:uncharacterized repeat protein (TIGR04076 family)
LERKASYLEITVLKLFDTKEVFKDPPIKAKYSGPCPVFKEGQVFQVDEYCCRPKEFCTWAWEAMFAMIMTLRFGGDLWGEYYEEPGVVVTCCPDGLRPVIFKLERK